VSLKYTLVVRDPDGQAVALLAGSEVPDWASDLVHPDDLEGSGGGYSAMKVDDLKAEIASRNEGREEADLIPSDGKKAELVAALEADDSK
jgi:hypothetical protein